MEWDVGGKLPRGWALVMPVRARGLWRGRWGRFPWGFFWLFPLVGLGLVDGEAGTWVGDLVVIRPRSDCLSGTCCVLLGDA